MLSVCLKSCIPKMLLYGQLKEGQRGLGRHFLHFRDTMKANLKSSNIDTENLEDTEKGGGNRLPKASRPLNRQERNASKTIDSTGNVALSPQHRTKPPAVSVEDCVSQG